MSRSSQSRRCVFCGGTPVSAEHVWPQWIRKSPLGKAAYASRTDTLEPHFVHGATIVAQGHEEPVVATASERRGMSIPSMDLTVKVPCVPCNTGWMSDLEGDVQPVFEELMEADDQTRAIAADEVDLIRRWVAKTSAMLEFTHPPTRTYDREIYAALYRGDRTLPGAWRFAAYRSSGRTNYFRATHTGGRYAAGSQRGAVSVTVLGVAQIVLAVFYASGPLADDLVKFNPQLPAPLELTSGTDLTWPAPGLDDEQWDQLMMPTMGVKPA